MHRAVLTLRLHVVRHAEAADDSDTGLDADRPLTPRGLRQAEALGAHLRAQDPRPALVIASPYRRARQTAEPLWAALDASPRLDDRLGADRALHDYLDVIAGLADAPGAVIVGHNPTCARLVALLLGGPTRPATQHETARLVTIDVDPAEPIGRGRAVASFRPDA